MKSENASPKKIYSAPTLKAYGDIREITQVLNAGAQFDNNSKTAKTA